MQQALSLGPPRFNNFNLSNERYSDDSTGRAATELRWVQRTACEWKSGVRRTGTSPLGGTARRHREVRDACTNEIRNQTCRVLNFGVVQESRNAEGKSILEQECQAPIGSSHTPLAQEPHACIRCPQTMQNTHTRSLGAFTVCE